MALSRDDLYNLGKTEAQSIRPSLAFREGDVSDAINSAAAVMAEAVFEEGARAFEATYLDGARGDKLTQWGDVPAANQLLRTSTSDVTVS